jgi:hypothetical protein
VGRVKEERAGVGTKAEGRAGIGRGNGMRAEGHASVGRGELWEGDTRDMRTREEGRAGKGHLRTRKGGRTGKGQECLRTREGGRTGKGHLRTREGRTRKGHACGRGGPGGKGTHLPMREGRAKGLDTPAKMRVPTRAQGKGQARLAKGALVYIPKKEKLRYLT